MSDAFFRKPFYDPFTDNSGHVVVMPFRQSLVNKVDTDQSLSVSVSDEIREWITENAPGTQWSHQRDINTNLIRLAFVFDTIERAIHFKLRWYDTE